MELHEGDGEPNVNQRMKRYRVKAEGKLGLDQVNLNTELRVREGERLVETGETRWKRASNLLEVKEGEQRIGN